MKRATEKLLQPKALFWATWCMVGPIYVENKLKPSNKIKKKNGRMALKVVAELAARKAHALKVEIDRELPAS